MRAYSSRAQNSADCPECRKVFVVVSFLWRVHLSDRKRDRERPRAPACHRLPHLLVQQIPCHAGAGLVPGTGSTRAIGLTCLREPAVGLRGPVCTRARLGFDGRLHLSPVRPRAGYFVFLICSGCCDSRPWILRNEELMHGRDFCPVFSTACGPELVRRQWPW